MSRLANRVALVTGAASGIGKGIALAFAREGADLVVADRVAEEGAAEVMAGIRQAGRAALFVRTDVADEGSVRAMAAAALGRFGRVDILVNNAGIFTESLIENLSIEDWDRVMNVNLRGVFLCTRALIGQMLERRDGRIINIASQLGQIGGRSIGHYAASKAGVIGLTKSLAREVAQRRAGQRHRARPDRDAAARQRDRGVAQRQAGGAADRAVRDGRRGDAHGRAARLGGGLLLCRADPGAERRRRDAVRRKGRT
ncbi:MAG: SDR family NAD(P)-dependent oxidoreductase [Dongiaceae bacterium]